MQQLKDALYKQIKKEVVVSLYHLAEDLEALLNDEESEEQEINKKLEELCENINDKADDIAKFIKSLKAQSESLKSEITNLQIRKQSTDNKVERIKEYVRNNMEKIGAKELGHLHKFKICVNGGKLPFVWNVNLEDQEDIVNKIPGDLLIKTFLPDNDEIRNRLDEGKKLEFVEYGERGTHVRIK